MRGSSLLIVTLSLAGMPRTFAATQRYRRAK